MACDLSRGERDRDRTMEGDASSRTSVSSSSSRPGSAAASSPPISTASSSLSSNFALSAAHLSAALQSYQNNPLSQGMSALGPLGTAAALAALSASVNGSAA